MKQPDPLLTLVSTAFMLLGFGLLIYINNNGSSPLLIVLLVVSFVCDVVFLTLAFPHFGRLPLKKIFVCALILLAGAVLTGAAAVLFSETSGWTPVGYSALMGGLPLLISIAVCLWYWGK